MSSGQGPNVNQLFQNAHEDGLLSSEALEALTACDVGAQIQNALGAPAQEVLASEVVLATLLIDDSGSIRFAGNAAAVRDGHNKVLEALAGGKQTAGVLVQTRYLNGHVLFPFRPLDKAERMTAQNYDPALGTPLYDAAVDTLGSVLAKTREFLEHGVPVRSVTLIVTDGDDQSSQRADVRKVAAVVGDMLRQENHIVAAMGVDDGHTDFRLIFRGMGIQDAWILTPGSDPKQIRQAFELFSRSAVGVGQAVGPLAGALGGFGGP